MKFATTLLMISVALILNGCSWWNPKPAFNTGLMVEINYGSGNCIPLINKKKYDPYSGTIYITNNVDLDLITQLNKDTTMPDSIKEFKLDSLNQQGIITEISDRKLYIELQPGTYTIIPAIDVTDFQANEVTVKENEITRAKIFFYHCISIFE